MLTEQRRRTRHVPTKTGLAESAEHWWVRVPEYDHHPSGELSISLPPRGSRGDHGHAEEAG